MALSKIGTNSLEDLSVTSGKVANDGIGPTQLDETANYAFTGTVTGTPSIENAQTFYNSTNKNLGSGTNTVIDSTFLALDTTGVGTIGSASNVTVSSGIFSFATTGYYLIQATMNFYMQSNDATRYLLGSIQATTNNSSYSTVAQAATNLANVTSNNDNSGVFVSYILDVTDTSNVKFRLSAQAESTTVKTENQNKGFQVQIIRLADT